jgi:hypothetical protein
MTESRRPRVPGLSPTTDDHDHDRDDDHGSPVPDEGKGSSGTWKKRVSTACLACKKSKRKVGLFTIQH